MNAANSYRHRSATAKRYPNAADASYFRHQFADKLLCAASSVGILTIIFFLFTM